VQIERAEVFLVPLRLREPFESSAATVQDRIIMLVALHGDGNTGWGECVAGETPHYSPETTETAWHVLTRFLLPEVVGRAHDGGAGVVRTVWAPVRGHPMAKAAVEMAAWDLQAKRDNVPLCTAIGGTRRAVPVGVSIGLQHNDDALIEQIESSLEEGYLRAKIKIRPGRDVDMLRSVRDRFPTASLMVDANSSYTIADLEHLRELDDLGLMMIEEPLAPGDFQGYAELQAALLTPVCLDESIGSAVDAERALELGSCRVINVKPGRVGGFGEARSIHDLCLGSGVPMWCGGMLESGVGRAHNVALSTLPGFTLPGDISASRRYWERDLVDPEWEVTGGALTPLESPGIGVEPDRARIEDLSVRRTEIA
jgi:O-succinylbenzoate synthase